MVSSDVWPDRRQTYGYRCLPSYTALRLFWGYLDCFCSVWTIYTFWTILGIFAQCAILVIFGLFWIILCYLEYFGLSALIGIIWGYLAILEYLYNFISPNMSLW